MPSPLPILTFASFTGDYKISQDANVKVDLALAIAKWEPYYLRNMMGVELYNLYIADSSAARFTAITAAFAEQDSEDVMHVSNGIADMLKGFIYYEFGRLSGVQWTPFGLVSSEAESAGAVPYEKKAGRLKVAQNAATDTYRAIQWYMSESDHKDDYEEYNGIYQHKMHMGGAIWS